MQRWARVALVVLALLVALVLVLAGVVAVLDWTQEMRDREAARLHRDAAAALDFPAGELLRTDSGSAGDWKNTEKTGHAFAQYPPERDPKALLDELALLLEAQGHEVLDVSEASPYYALQGRLAGGGGLSCSSHRETYADPEYVSLWCRVHLPP